MGMVLVFNECFRDEGTAYLYYFKATCLFFAFGGLGLILKKYIYYQYGNLRVAFLGKRSLAVDNLVFKIVLLTLIVLLNNALVNWGLRNQHTTCLLLCSGLALLGVFLNIRPTLVLTPKGFYYDDYIPIRWKWDEIESIFFYEDLITIRGKKVDFEIELDLLQKEDTLLSRVLRTEVQQFGDTPEDFRKWLYEYANRYGVACTDVPV